MAESYYALEKFAEAERSLMGIIEALPLKRRAIDIYRQKGNIQRAKETYLELDAVKDKLLDTTRNLRLLFSECDMQEGADFANKLYGAARQFHLMTKDYTKLIAAVKTLKDYIPHTETMDARLIGHLMNNVKMGYYPTDMTHVKRIKQSLKFPNCSVNLLDKTTPRLIQFHTLKKCRKSAVSGRFFNFRHCSGVGKVAALTGGSTFFGGTL